ncbi:cytochrome-c peroxidase [Aquabacterium sp.]|uniref:cytochrome-c peroxidase n=1 Tax=Aquabacterium sp. TaxID=1872578 RepID=UPI0037831DA0
MAWQCRWSVAGVLVLVLALAACVNPPPAWQGAAYAPRAGGATPDAATLAALGRALFFDPQLSASGQVACASCHDPRFAFGPPNARPVQLAGLDGRTPGLRAAPSLRYLQTLPPFSEHFFDDDGDDSQDAGPTGGHAWDGRASSAHEQARLPLLSPQEMANSSPAALAQRLAGSPQAEALRRGFGPRLFDDPAAVLQAVALALEVFQQSPAEFHPFSSRYDAVLRGQAALTEREARGLALFNDPAKGNCASCHPSAPRADGGLPVFTDFGHVALGVPRLRTLPANADPSFFDLGLCGPLRQDLRERDAFCGRFRTPTLRNSAVKQRFFHNGVFGSLKEVLRFYARRDTEPALFYPRGVEGRVRKFDDLPPRWHGNVSTEPPFDRRPGDAPALSDDEIDDVIAFLQTLTDADLLPDPRAVPPAASRS